VVGAVHLEIAAHVALTEAHFRNGDKEAAEAARERAVELSPPDE
jgi:Flp pilus assembly protein TadD